MKTLTIKDLAATCELDHSAMSAVRGGHSMSAPSTSYQMFPTMPSYPSSGDSSIHADQSLQQYQSVLNATANGSGFVDGVHAKNDTSQFGQNNVLVYR
jgi:hypothetical protein